MLSFFRRFINSKVGVIVTFVVLGVIALAFAAGDVTGLRTSAMGGLTGNTVATVGKGTITVAELKRRVGDALQNVRQEQPQVTTEQFITQGGFDGVLQQLIGSLAMEQFGRAEDMVVSKRLVDGQIVSIPGLQGPTGKFDRDRYEQLLATRRLTDGQVRADIAGTLIAQQLLAPTLRARLVPAQLALPYASLLLERRAGEAVLVSTAAMPAGAAPTDAEVQAFYQSHLARYALPERRVLRYALVTPASVAARSVPSQAEVAQAYRQQQADFVPTEKRTISQVVLLNRAAADTLAAKVKGGTSLADAARAAGLEASVQTGVRKSAYAGLTSPAVADAVFAAPRGGVVGPVRGGIGWIVAKVDSIEAVPGKTLDQARPELVAALTKAKTQASLAAIHDALDDTLANSATFDEAVADQKLTAQTTPALTAAGLDPADPAAKPDPALAPIVAGGFQLQEGDAPQMAPIGTDGSFALIAVGRVVAAAPRPLADVRTQVARDLQQDRQQAAARRAASFIATAVGKGQALGQAAQLAGVPVGPARPLAASRAELAANPQGAPAPLVLMFGMAQGAARTLEAPGGQGWYVVKLNRIVAGNAAADPRAVAAARSELAGGIGREYAAQFLRAVRNSVGVKVDPAAATRARTELTGGGDQN